MFFVGKTGFEPATSRPPGARATGLRYIPNYILVVVVTGFEPVTFPTLVGTLRFFIDMFNPLYHTMFIFPTFEFLLLLICFGASIILFIEKNNPRTFISSTFNSTIIMIIQSLLNILCLSNVELPVFLRF